MEENQVLVNPSTLIAAIFAGAAVILGAVLFLLSKRKQVVQGQDDGQVRERRRPQPVNREDGPRVAGARRRVPRARMRPQRDESDEEPAEEFHQEEDKKKIGTKKLRKLEEKERRKAEREEEEREREDRKQRQAEYEEMRKHQDLAEEEKEKKLEEEERIRKEEEERLEHEAYLEMKKSFVVEEEGQEKVLSEEQSQSILQEFIDYIQQEKVVVLEELGARFDMRAQEAIKRVQELQEQGRLSGVIDDRGKFISITPEELEDVAKFIRQRGRVSITELAEASNTLINLDTGVAADTAVETAA